MARTAGSVISTNNVKVKLYLVSLNNQLTISNKTLTNHKVINYIRGSQSFSTTGSSEKNLSAATILDLLMNLDMINTKTCMEATGTGERMGQLYSKTLANASKAIKHAIETGSLEEIKDAKDNEKMVLTTVTYKSNVEFTESEKAELKAASLVSFTKYEEVVARIKSERGVAELVSKPEGVERFEAVQIAPVVKQVQVSVPKTYKDVLKLMKAAPSCHVEGKEYEVVTYSESNKLAYLKDCI